MNKIESLIQHIKTLEGCLVYPSSGQPKLHDGLSIPEDLSEFYKHCGGMDLFNNSEFRIHISSPKELVKSNVKIFNEDIQGDITENWFIIGKSRTDEYISIDLSDTRNGRCYDSYADRHGVAGSCPIIATSFYEFIENCTKENGNNHFWLMTGFVSYGDAYK